MSLWITCDADGCDARTRADAWEGRERGAVEVGVSRYDGAGWYEYSNLTHGRFDLCPEHVPRGRAMPFLLPKPQGPPPG